MDFSADGPYLNASYADNHSLVIVDWVDRKVMGTRHLGADTHPLLGRPETIFYDVMSYGACPWAGLTLRCPPVRCQTAWAGQVRVPGDQGEI
jgi:hypothetical protein